VRQREFLLAFGGAVTAWPLMVRAQPSPSVIGFLATTTLDDFAGYSVTIFLAASMTSGGEA
jgi:hypothetical protein